MAYTQDELRRAQDGFNGFIRFSSRALIAIIAALILMKYFLI